jgi:fused signal recognition particle receptor
MAGFFKKLFNRIVGKKEDETPPSSEQVALPAPVATVEPEFPIVEEVAPALPPPKAKLEKKAVVHVKPLPKAKDPPPKVIAKAVVKKAAAKKPEPIKVVPKKPVPKPVIPAVVKKAETKAKTAKVVEPRKPVKVVVPSVEPKTAPVTPTAKPVEVPRPIAVVPIPADIPEIKARVVPLVPPPGPLTPRTKPFAKAVPLPVPAPLPEPEKKGWLSRLKDGLSKSSKSITGSITAIFTKRKLDASTLQELEDILIQADLGIAVAERIIKAVAAGRHDKEIDPEEVKQILASEIGKVLRPVEVPFNFGQEKPYVILVVGVNGSGKTTTIGKLGAIAADEGYKVKFAACDTFRAAAIEQLTVWGERIGAQTISRPQGADAAGLAYDAMKACEDDGTDILFVDTAGRLHNKTYLMDELDKVVRVIKKYDANAPHAVLLVLDATTGQNALAQAEAFTKVAGVTGLIMTKLDGTARGGILVAIAERFKLPIHAVGVGESIDDLQPFDADAFARAIAGLEVA